MQPMIDSIPLARRDRANDHIEQSGRTETEAVKVNKIPHLFSPVNAKSHWDDRTKDSPEILKHGSLEYCSSTHQMTF